MLKTQKDFYDNGEIRMIKGLVISFHQAETNFWSPKIIMQYKKSKYIL